MEIITFIGDSHLVVYFFVKFGILPYLLLRMISKKYYLNTTELWPNVLITIYLVDRTGAPKMCYYVAKN